MFTKIKKRITNPKVFMAVCSALLLLLVNIGVIDVDMSAKLQDSVNSILTIGIAVGIFANPEKHLEDY